jgi:RimJ/RimL family protein N-acetyltransferase
LPPDYHPEKTVKRLGFTNADHFRENFIVNRGVTESVFYALLKRDWESRTPS